MILLPLEIEDLGGQCSEISAKQLERTERSALYLRSDGYLECFRVTRVPHATCDNGVWTQTGDVIERYPSLEEFGQRAWCGKQEIREMYKQLVVDEVNLKPYDDTRMP